MKAECRRNVFNSTRLSRRNCDWFPAFKFKDNDFREIIRNYFGGKRRGNPRRDRQELFWARAVFPPNLMKEPTFQTQGISD